MSGNRYPDIWRVGDIVRTVEYKDYAWSKGSLMRIVEIREEDIGKPAHEYQVFWTTPVDNPKAGEFWTTPKDVELPTYTPTASVHIDNSGTVVHVKPKPKITAVAVRYQAPKFDPACPDYGPIIISVPRPGRHHNILHPLSQISSAAAIDGEQGFLTDEGQFLTREEAMELVKKNGQLLMQRQPNQLFSEDLW